MKKRLRGLCRFQFPIFPLWVEYNGVVTYTGKGKIRKLRNLEWRNLVREKKNTHFLKYHCKIWDKCPNCGTRISFGCEWWLPFPMSVWLGAGISWRLLYTMELRMPRAPKMAPRKKAPHLQIPRHNFFCTLLLYQTLCPISPPSPPRGISAPAACMDLLDCLLLTPNPRMPSYTGIRTHTWPPQSL